MASPVCVYGVQAINDAMRSLGQTREEIFRICAEGIVSAGEVLEETRQEEQVSGSMLQAAVAVEQAKHALVIELEMELAAAAAELAAATPANPVAMAAAGIKIAELTPRLTQAQEEYRIAAHHREALDRRYELAVKCVNMARERLDTLRMKYEAGKRNIEIIADKGIARLRCAYCDLNGYISRMAPDVRKEIENWERYKPAEKAPVKPGEIHDRLDVSNSVVNAVLEYLYATDMGFRANVDRYCLEMKNGLSEGTEIKIKKNMVGRLCEEIVIRAFEPISTRIVTQERETLPDGSYTKVDLLVYGLTNPVILGRGEGMGAREGGSLGIEVKSGHGAYLYAQLEHMEKQAIGHSGCDASCVICTRDIKDISPQRQEELRNRLKAAGSPIVGMLPRKDDLDAACIGFVKGKLKNVR